MGKSKELATLTDVGGTIDGALTVDGGYTDLETQDVNNYARITTLNGSAQLGLYRSGSAEGGFYLGGDADKFRVYDSSFTPRMEVDASGRVTMPYQPAFRAYLSTEWTTISAYVNSGWTEQYDRNNNFNQGTFTAPVEGVYNFTVAWDALSTQSRLCLDRNGSFTGGFRYEPTGLTTDAWETHSYSADVFLNTNDYVKLYLEGGGGTNPIHMGGNQWGFFAGHLVG